MVRPSFQAVIPSLLYFVESSIPRQGKPTPAVQARLDRCDKPRPAEMNDGSRRMIGGRGLRSRAARRVRPGLPDNVGHANRQAAVCPLTGATGGWIRTATANGRGSATGTLTSLAGHRIGRDD